ncbi:hypothetical protein NQ314_010535 [Rhamnusium bicolor]|uniref:Uncharacterized protein n=1 Tax=Rhamnusium bicolor TaxID=1586634 RepID=A0AAV8XPR4_9CUCU|nr:hypothetical protein NQ314_010535 [Rhamnusium bicolor]
MRRSLNLDAKTVEFENIKYKVVKYEETEPRVADISWLTYLLMNLIKNTRLKLTGKKSRSSTATYDPLPQEEADSEEFDWWTKFYASLEVNLHSLYLLQLMMDKKSEGFSVKLD